MHAILNTKRPVGGHSMMETSLSPTHPSTPTVYLGDDVAGTGVEHHPAVLADPQQDDSVLLEQLPDEVAEPSPGKRPDRNNVDLFRGERQGNRQAHEDRQVRKARDMYHDNSGAIVFLSWHTATRRAPWPSRLSLSERTSRTPMRVLPTGKMWVSHGEQRTNNWRQKEPLINHTLAAPGATFPKPARVLFDPRRHVPLLVYRRRHLSSCRDYVRRGTGKRRSHLIRGESC